MSKIRIGVLAVFAVLGSMLIGATAPHAAATTCSDTFGGGAGTEEAPYLISTVLHLEDLADAGVDCLSKYFLQTHDISLNPAIAWSPIGPAGRPFTGNYDGNGRTVSDLFLAQGDYQGLFGSAVNAVISNLTIRGAASTTASPFVGQMVGTLAGFTVGTQISGVRIRTTMNVDGNGTSTGIYVGGMIGSAESTTITSSEILAGSRVEGAFAVGGLVGNMFRGSMSNSRSSADVRTHAASSPFVSSAAGGLIGWLEGPASITASESYGDVYAWDGTSAISTGGDSIGGAVGILVRDATMTNVVAEGDVTGLRRIGGVVGDLLDASVTDSVGHGNIRGEQYVGGAIGASSGSTIEGSTAMGDITCDSGSYAGGFIGWASTNTSIRNAGATGSVSQTGTCDRVGGFAGQVDGSASLDDTYASGVVTGTRFVGGLVGFLAIAEVSNSYASGTVNGTDRVGGLIGIAATNAVIAQTRASGSVSGTEYVGGLAGLLGNYEDAPTPGSDVHLSQSFATGDVTSSGQYAGGIVGLLFGDSFISDSFATGAVTADAFVGSLIGKYQGTHIEVVQNSYGTGELTAESAPIRIGGVVGGLEVSPDGRFSSTYWDPTLTGVSFGIGDGTGGTNTEGVSPLTAIQMRNSTNFVGWNFSSVWGYQCGVSTTPQLRWNNPLATATSAGPCPSPAPPTPSPSDGSLPSGSEPEPQTVTASQPVTQTPGTVGFTINGQVTPLTTEIGPRGSGLTLQAGPVAFTLRSQTAAGQRIPVSPDGSLILPRTGQVPISGDGLDPNSSVAITLFSDPIALGSSGVSADGTFTASPVIPSTVPIGAHTLQLSGRTKTGDPFILSVGVLVETPAAALGANPVITVRPKIITPGASVSVTAQGVQAGCRVSFTLAGKRANATASKKGVAQVQITMPEKLPRTVSLRASVTGPKCNAVAVSERVPAARRSAS